MNLSFADCGPATGCSLSARVLIGAPPSEERSALESRLLDWGHCVEVAEDQTALLADLEHTDGAPILLVDVALAGLNGVALLHQLQQRSSRRRTWTIALVDPAAPLASSSTRAGRIVTVPNSSATQSPEPNPIGQPRRRLPGIDDILLRPVEEFELRVCLHAAMRIQALHADMIDSMESSSFHATHDTLTGLWNRESLLTQLFQETDRTQRRGSPLAFLVLDLDGFARINRDHGYDGGDNVLRQLAGRLRRCLRSYDLIGRLGADQFLIAMPGATLEDSRIMASRLSASIADRPLDILKASLRTTASIGIAQSQGRSPPLVLREAEFALASAKLAGGDCFRFFTAEREAVVASGASAAGRQEAQSKAVHA